MCPLPTPVICFPQAGLVYTACQQQHTNGLKSGVPNVPETLLLAAVAGDVLAAVPGMHRAGASYRQPAAVPGLRVQPQGPAEHQPRHRRHACHRVSLQLNQASGFRNSISPPAQVVVCCMCKQHCPTMALESCIPVWCIDICLFSLIQPYSASVLIQPLSVAVEALSHVAMSDILPHCGAGTARTCTSSWARTGRRRQAAL